MNTHELLKEYHSYPNYGEIAKFAAGLAKGTPDVDYILAQVKEAFGTIEYLTMKNAPQPFRMFGALGDNIPINAYEQLETALMIPPALRGAIMPDAHYGYSVPIGGVVELDNAVNPAYIGYDISCMVMLSIFDVQPDDFMKYREQFAEALKAETAFGVGSAFEEPKEHAVMDSRTWDEIQVVKTLKSLAQQQLGSSGGGNHFADLVIGEWIEQGGFFVGLMTHSGSRGTGHKLATHYTKLADTITKYKAKDIPKGYGWLDMDTEEGQEYFAAMELMGDYALANHELIHTHFADRAEIAITENHWNRHNFAWEESPGKFIHRKGATPAHLGKVGIIPGTSGTHSYLTEGLGNPESLNSSSHGAGRPHSRTQAKKDHDESAYDAQTAEKDVLHYGVATDETYQAYKDIEEVMGVQDGILFKRLAVLEPKVVIMGGKK